MQLLQRTERGREGREGIVGGRWGQNGDDLKKMGFGRKVRGEKGERFEPLRGMKSTMRNPLWLIRRVSVPSRFQICALSPFKKKKKKKLLPKVNCVHADDR